MTGDVPAAGSAQAAELRRLDSRAELALGLRVAGTIGSVAAAVAWFVLWRREVWSIDLRPWPLVVLAVAALVFAVRSQAPERVAAPVIVGACGVLAAGWEIFRWVTVLLGTGFSIERLPVRAGLWLYLVVLFLGVVLSARVTQGRRRLHLSHVPGAEQAHSPRPARTAGWTLAALALVAVLLAALRWYADPVEQHVAAAPSSEDAPATPVTLAGTITWTRDLDAKVLDTAAGIRGPVVLAGDTVLGLDPADGSTLWSYQRRGAHAAPFEDTVILSEQYMVMSPDGRYGAVRYAGPRDVPEKFDDEDYGDLVVLDTTTGRTVLQLTGQLGDLVLLSNRVALIGRHAYELSDGTTITAWDETLADDLPRDPGRVRPRGALPSGFVLSSDCARQAYQTGRADCPVFVTGELDPTARRAVDRVVELPAPRSGDGWAVRRVDSSTGTTRDDPADEDEAELAAFDLETGDSFPLGHGSSVSYDDSRQAILLYADLSPDVAETLGLADRYADAPSAVVDVAARSAVPITLDDARAEEREDMRWRDHFPPTSVTTDMAYAGVRGSLVLVVRPDGSDIMREQLDRPYYTRASVVAAPGTVVVAATSGKKEEIGRSRLYGLT